MRKRLIALALTAMVPAACATGPAYEPPVPPTTAAGPFVTIAAGTDPVAPLPDDWWRLYEDPALDALIEQAFAANTDLRVAVANLERARAVSQEARAGRLPATTIEGGIGYGDALPGGGALPGGAAAIGTAQAGFAWELDLFGRVGSRIAAAEADEEAEAALRDATRVAVAARTTQAYMDACANAYSLTVARRSLEVSRQNLDLIETLERAGVVGMLDVEAAAAGAARARAAIPPLEAARQVALFELAALLGATPREVPASAHSCDVPPEPVADIPVGDGAALLRRRPDVREAERRLAAEVARVGVATADLYPTVSFAGIGNFLRSDGVGGADSFSFSLGPLLSWNFPNRSVARARVRQAEASGDAALARFDGTVLTALKEVEQALARVAANREEHAALLDAEARAEKAWRFAELRYRSGSVAYLDVLVALDRLLDARAASAASMQRLATARVDLFRALGGGWQNDATDGAEGGGGTDPGV